MQKKRLDVLLVERGLVESRSLAQRLVMAGLVRVKGQVVLKAATTFPGDVEVLLEQPPPFVSRGGEKLLAALTAFSIPAAEKICADVGASTGGFTDCLLQHGARRVYAIDVGKGILHWKIRQNPRVVVMEETNARYVEGLPEAVELVTIDASFISLKILLPVVKAWFAPTANPSAIPAGTQSGSNQAGQVSQVLGSNNLVTLIKPQFEAGKAEVARGDGVIRDPLVHRRVLEEIILFAQSERYSLQGLIRSPLLGPKGNKEFLLWLKYPAEKDASVVSLDFDLLVS